MVQFGRLVGWLWLVVIAPLSAEEVVFGFRPVAPYVVPGNDGTLSGIEYEIIAAALAVTGHTPQPVSMPLARLIQSFKAGALEAAAPVLALHNTGGVLSTPYLTYRNVALALESSGLKLRSVADLKGLSIAAFQTARTVLGAAFAAAVEANPGYTEEAQQVTQVRLLLSGRVDVIVGDSRILNQLLRSSDVGMDPGKKIIEYDLFAPTDYSVAFWDPGLAGQFNDGLAKIHANGTYRKIVDRYR